MNIELTSGQIALVHITIEAPSNGFELYGGTQKGSFQIDYSGSPDYEWLCTIREADVVGTPLGAFNIYARELTSGREYTILSGKIIVKPRTASVPADKLHPVEYFVTVPVRNEQVDAAGNVIVQGIPGPKGERGENGEPGEGGVTEEERALLMGAAQRDADNTFTAANTFTGAVDMSGASVTPPEGWNVGNLTPEAIQQVAPIAWGVGDTTVAPTAKSGGIAIGYNSSALVHGVAIGENAYASSGDTVVGQGARGNTWSCAFGYGAKPDTYSFAAGIWAEAKGHNTIGIGYYAHGKKATSVTIGSQFTETTDSGNVTHTCTTEGTGSITIGAGANTLNNGSTESSNSITIGCKASNQGADSVVIGASAIGTSFGNVVIGAAANATSTSAIVLGQKATGYINAAAIGYNAIAQHHSIAIGHYAKTTSLSGLSIGNSSIASKYGVSLGHYAASNANCSIAIGHQATVSDYGATVIRSTAEDGTITQLYFSGANTPLANTYEGGEAMMGYVTKDSSGNVVAAGTNKLSALFPNNSGFQPMTMSLDDEWEAPKVFHPSDLDMPQDEPTEPEEYQPLPVYPIVEPEIEPFTE